MSERPLFDIKIAGSVERPEEIRLIPKRPNIKRKLDLSQEEWEDLGKRITEATDVMLGDRKMHLDSGWRSPKTENDPVWRIRPQDK